MDAANWQECRNQPKVAVSIFIDEPYTWQRLISERLPAEVKNIIFSERLCQWWKPSGVALSLWRVCYLSAVYKIRLLLVLAAYQGNHTPECVMAVQSHPRSLSWAYQSKAEPRGCNFLLGFNGNFGPILPVTEILQPKKEPPRDPTSIAREIWRCEINSATK